MALDVGMFFKFILNGKKLIYEVSRTWVEGNGIQRIVASFQDL